MTQLHVFALNEPVSISHTNLTRQRGEAPDLPPLQDWLGVDALDTDRIELFPISDLGGMDLSDYVNMAFEPAEEIVGDTRSRLNALSGSVLLVPERALSEPTKPRAQLTQIATLPLAQADHAAQLPKADATPTASRAPTATEPERTPPIALYALIAMAIFAVLAVFVGWN